MKIVSSWSSKYIGIEHKRMVYYFCWNHKDHRNWGYTEDYYDGPIKRFSLYFIAFLWHYDQEHICL